MPETLHNTYPTTLVRLAQRQAVESGANRSDVARYWAKVRCGRDCWTWTSNRTPDGYGQIWLGGRPVYAHRLAWLLAHGPIPKGLSVLHRCDVPACVNPNHLFLGTQLDNMRDAAAKGRLHAPHPKAQRVSDAEVLQILGLCANGRTQTSVAMQFGVSAGFVSLLCNGRRRAPRRTRAA